ncbi:hypothetical protein VNI00_013895 [Paramarasmius palmivorus]|uniref:Uncharacterized protein n=1 Tax=Paramarasmius palmivorus TaxID=297713 RepID=A0AAW0BXG8_9AGAR
MGNLVSYGGSAFTYDEVRQWLIETEGYKHLLIPDRETFEKSWTAGEDLVYVRRYLREQHPKLYKRLYIVPLEYKDRRSRQLGVFIFQQISDDLTFEWKPDAPHVEDFKDMFSSAGLPMEDRNFGTFRVGRDGLRVADYVELCS